MKKIKEWVSPVGIVILVILAGMIKMDTSNMGKSHGKSAAKKHHVQRGERGQRAERGQRSQRATEWRKAMGERLGKANRSKDSESRGTTRRTPRKK